MITDRNELIQVSLKWEEKYGVMPAITSAISEFDAVLLVAGQNTNIQHILNTEGKTAVTKGADFEYNGLRYQVKANRPSGKKGSKVTRVPNASNLEWDCLIWILYNPLFEIEEAWIWDVNSYSTRFPNRKQRIHPKDMREGKQLK